MNVWFAVIIAIVAIALAAFALFKIYGTFPQSHIDGLDDIKATATAANTKAITNAANIKAINTQLGVVDTATSSFTAVSGAAVTPPFPIALT